MSEEFARNVTKSAASLEKTRQTIEATAVNEHLLEAATHAEDTLKNLQQEWTDRGLTPEQAIFSLALVTINVREGVPAKHGGKETFDRIAAEARKYFDANR